VLEKEILRIARQQVLSAAPFTKYSCVVDFTRPANQHRLFVIDNRVQKIIYQWYTTHGSGSGPIEKCKSVSNIWMSRKSSAGLMLTGQTYVGKHGYSLKLIGKEPGVNDKVLDRAIVIHPSEYVSVAYMSKHQYPGRSWGCICLDPGKSKELIDLLKGGSVLYVIAP
jgi:hypothetical protein